MSYLRIGMQTLNEMIDNGLPYVWLGNKKMFDMQDVESYLNERKVY